MTEESHSERLVFDDRPKSGSSKKARNRGPVYCRSSSSARHRLEGDLLKLYRRHDQQDHEALVFPSGMTAISSVMMSLVRSREEPFLIVHGDELYTDVFRTVRYVEESFPGRVGSRSVNVRDVDSLRRLFETEGRRIRVFHWEAASNPSGQMLDTALLPELKGHAPDCVFVCDNTWLSGAAYNPLDHGADLVVESMTKYLSGGTCIGGMAVGRQDVMQPVAEFVRVAGLFVDADRCRLFSRQLADLEGRVRHAGGAAQQVAEWLEADEQVMWVDYPLLRSHPSYPIASKLLTTVGPGCVWVQLPISKSKLLKVLTTNDPPVEFKTSFGGPESRVDPWPEGDVVRDANGVESRVVRVRLALGFVETAEESKAKIGALLDQLFS